MALAKPRPGDLIEIFRLGYEHWAIYVGSGYVVHLAAQGSISGDSAASVSLLLTEKAIVKKERLCDVTRGDEYRVNNKHDEKYQPLPPSKIVQLAEKLVGQEILYKLTSKNCEHFVNVLRYGVPRSDQFIDKVIGGLLQSTEFVIEDLFLFLDRTSQYLANVRTRFLWSLWNLSTPEKQ